MSRFVRCISNFLHSHCKSIAEIIIGFSRSVLFYKEMFRKYFTLQSNLLKSIKIVVQFLANLIFYMHVRIKKYVTLVRSIDNFKILIINFGCPSNIVSFVFIQKAENKRSRAKCNEKLTRGGGYGKIRINST